MKKSHCFFISKARLLVFVCLLTGVSGFLKAQSDSLKINHQESNGWLKGVAVGACLGAGLLLDQPVNNWCGRHQNEFSLKATDVSDMLGEKTIMVPALLTTFAGSYVFKNQELKTISWNAMRAVVMSAVATECLKYSVGRQRPFVDGNNLNFSPFSGADYNKSLPSGHTSLAFAIFTPFAETYSRWIYLIPASVAIGRVYQQQHWLTDVMVGGGIGWLSGYLLTHSKKKIIVGPGGLVIWF